MKKQILLIDDNEEIRSMLASLLEFQGVQVTQARDGLEAFGMAQVKNFDLIITDCDMPVMNGLEFTKAMKGLGVKTPLVMFSGSDTAKEIFVGALGGTAFFEKTEVRELQFYAREVLGRKVS